jgi:hypothetical protein
MPRGSATRSIPTRVGHLVCAAERGGSLCNAANTHESAVGNPGGSIATRVDVTANLVTLFRGSGTWTSPSFTVPAGGPVTGATFRFDRRFDAGGLLNLGPASKVDVKLVDQTVGSTTTLLSETLGSADSTFATRPRERQRGLLLPVTPTP